MRDKAEMWAFLDVLIDSLRLVCGYSGYVSVWLKLLDMFVIFFKGVFCGRGG